MSYSERSVWLEMNDQIRLDASVFTPEGNAPAGGWPGILLVHGHGDAGNKTSMFGRARRYAEHGYVTLSYSVRGQGCSEGLVFHMGARELFDLQDVIDWMLNELPIHPEKLAVAGSSQGGWHAFMAAAHHPQVATVIPENFDADTADFAVHNGCLSKWFFTRTMRRRILTAGLQEMAREWALSGDWYRVEEAVRVTSPDIFVDRIKCPVFMVHGWHDVGMPPNPTVRMFDSLNVPKKLYIGGGGHDGLDSGEAQKIREKLIDQWLDYWLKGEKNGIMDEPAVLYTRRPGWEHVGEDRLPPEDVEAQIFYLRTKVHPAPSSSNPKETMSVVLPAPDRMLHEDPPEGPDVHSNITNRPIDENYTLKSALADDMEGVGRALIKEVIAFEGEAFDEEREILGAPEAKLHLMPNRPYFQVIADLYDVGSDGERNLISRGQYGTRTSEPGKHVTVDVEMRTIGYLLEAGHRIRLEISNYDTTYAFPYFEPFVARLYHEYSHPSCIVIPMRRVS